MDENVKSRRREAEKAEAIVSEEVLNYQRWQNTLGVIPTIVSLKEKAEGIVRAELEKSGSWMQSLTAAERVNIEILAGSIINKILHDPIVILKEESQDHGVADYVAALRRLFKLEE